MEKLKKNIICFKEQTTIQFMMSLLFGRARQKLLIHFETDTTLSLRVTDEQVTKS